MSIIASAGPFRFLLAAACLASAPAFAGTVTCISTSTLSTQDLTQGTAWDTGVVPTSADTVVFGPTSYGGTSGTPLTLGSNMSWGSLVFTGSSATGATINIGNATRVGNGTLTLGDITVTNTDNIAMSAVIYNDITLSKNVTYAVEDGAFGAELSLRCIVSGAFGITKTGDGVVLFGPTGTATTLNSTFTGPLTLSGGVVKFSNGGGWTGGGSITRAAGGGTLLIEPGVGVTSDVRISNSNTNGILAAWAVIKDATTGFFEWAVSNGTGSAITSYASYSNDSYGSGATNTNVSATSTAPTGFTVNSLRFAPTTAAITLTLSGTNTLNSGGILVGSSTAFDTTITGGTIQAASGGELFIGNATPNTNKLLINSVLSGTGGLTTVGPTSSTSIIQLGGVNTFTGNIRNYSGIIDITGAGQLGSGNFAGNIINSSAMKFSTSANQTLSGVISGGGGLRQEGTGTLTLTGANTFYGNASTTTAFRNTITSGKIITGNTTALGKGTWTITGGTLQIGNGTVNTVTGVAGIIDTATRVGLSLSGTAILDQATQAAGNKLTIANQNGTANDFQMVAGTTWKIGRKPTSYTSSTTGNPTADGSELIDLSGGTYSITGGTLDLGGVFDSALAGRYKLISGTGTVSGLTIIGYAGVHPLSSLTFDTNGNLTIPEPATYGVLGAGALAGLAVVRRRRKAA